MQLKNFNVYFFFLVIFAVSVLTYLILKPFLVPLIVAAIFAHLFGFMYEKLLKWTGKKGISSALACLVVALIIIIPLSLVVILVANEIQGILENISDRPDSAHTAIQVFLDKISAYNSVGFLDIKQIISEDTIINALKSVSQNALSILQSTYKGVAHFIFVTFIMFFSLFYLFIDGEKLVGKIIRLSPLKDEYENILLDKFRSIVRATVKGTSLIAILQGAMGAALFALTGVPSPVLLGILMTISSVIPSIGSGLVWLPTGLIMLLSGDIFAGMTILLVGGGIISTVDNVIRPKLVGRDTQLHPLMILFSTLGGIAIFGITGFIVGPIIMSLFVALWQIYEMEFGKQLQNFNRPK